LNLRVGEGWDDLTGWSWNLHPVEGVIVDDALRDEPGEEDSQAAQVAVDGMPG